MQALLQALTQSRNPNLQDLGDIPQISPTLKDLHNALSGVAAGTAGLPVDLMTTMMRPFGYDEPRPVGGSEWMGEQLGADPESGAFIGGTFGSPDPMDALKLAALAPGLVKAAKLPMDEASRLERAKEMGFDTDVYHGTADDVSEFSAREGGKNTKARSAKNAFWFVDDPQVAEGYAKMAAEDAPVQRLVEQSYAAERRGDWDAAHDLMVQAEQLEPQLVGGGGANVMPLKIKSDNFMQVDADGATMADLEDAQLHEWVQEAKRGGFSGLRIDNFSDNADWGNYRPATHYAVFKPEDIRSRFAAFDPAKKDSTNLLASHPAATVLGGSLAAALLAQMAGGGQTEGY